MADVSIACASYFLTSGISKGNKSDSKKDILHMAIHVFKVVLCELLNI